MTTKMRVSTAIFLATLISSPLEGQAVDGGETLRRASVLLQNGDATAAAALLRAELAAGRVEPRGFFVLARALQRLGDPEGARIALWAAAGQSNELSGAAFYQIGLMFAEADDRDAAFVWLSRSKQAGTWDLTALDREPAAASILNDPRIQTLLPTAEEFADPFLESVHVIAEWRGEGPGDQFGWLARSLGDVTGDGVSEVIASAPTFGSDDTSGKLYLLSVPDQSVLWTVVGEIGESLGSSVEAAGDFDDDGFPDVVVGAPGSGRAYVLSGIDGDVIRIFEGDPGTNFGGVVAGVGDVDGDGLPEVAISAVGADAGRGEVSIYSRAQRPIRVLRGRGPGHLFGSNIGSVGEGRGGGFIIGAPGAGATGEGALYAYGVGAKLLFTLEAQAAGTALGGGFASIPGDLGGDGSLDFYASDFRDAVGGRIYVVSGADGELLYTQAARFRGEGFGIGAANVGDLDGDGLPDLAVGAWLHSSEAPKGGRIYFLRGFDGAQLGTITAAVAGETFGFDVAGIGDVDGDGIADILATAARSAVRGAWTGRVWVISGAFLRNADGPQQRPSR